MPSASPSAAASAVTYAPPAPRAALAAATGVFAPRPAGATVVAAAAGPAGAPAPGPALYDALVDALRSERRLVDDLTATMRRQRAAVAGDDLDAVDDTVFATHRVLATLGQARLRRRQLNRLFAGADELPLRALADAACAHAEGRHRENELRGACDALAAGAAALAREVDVNRRVLRDALALGERHARALGAAGAAAGGPAVDRTA